MPTPLTLRTTSQPEPRSAGPAIPVAVGIAVAALLAFGASVPLTQSDGDLFAHIAFGRRVLSDGALPITSVLGFAATPTPAIAPAWGAATLFAALERWGGLGIIAACVAVLAGATHGALARFLRSRGAGATHVLVISLVGLALASSHWLARPHAFTLAASAALIILLEANDRRWLWLVPPLFAVWSNLHGGWVFGIIVLGCYVIGSCLAHFLGRGDHHATFAHTYTILFAASCIATLCNPYGIQLHAAIWRSLSDPSVASVINEYQPPSFRSPTDLLFFAVIVAASAGLAMSRHLPPLAWTLVALVGALFSFRASRNISLFAVTAFPLMALHFSADIARWKPRSTLAADLAKYDATHEKGGWWLLAYAVILLVAASGGRIGSVQLIANAVESGRFPVAATRALDEERIDRPLLTTWAWSGYVPFASPGRRTYFDPLSFTPETLRAYGTILLTRSGWEHTLDSLGVDLVLAPPTLPLADSLVVSREWRVRRRDRFSTLFEREPAGLRREGVR